MMKKVSVLVWVSCFAIAAYAQEQSEQPQQPSKLTFKEAVKIGLEKNLTLNQQENLLVTSRVVKTSGLMGMGPTVNIDGSASRFDGNSFSQQDGIVVNGIRDNINASINASMPLFRGLNAINTYRQSSSAYEAQLHFVNRTQQDVIRDVSSQYLLCLLDQQLVRINEKNLETQEKQYSQIQEQVAAGSRAEVDLKTQEYQVKNATLLVLRARNTLRNDKMTLAQTIQLDPSVSFELEDPSWTVADDLDSLSTEELYKIAEERRSDLERARQNEKAAQFGYRATQGTYFPSISAFASYGSAYNYTYRNDVQTEVDNRSFNQQFLTDNKALVYGVSFNIPIYGAFQNRTNVTRNRMLYQNAKLQTESTELQVKSEVLQAHQNLMDAQAAFEAATAQLEAAKTSFQLEQERYNLGISDIVVLTQSTQAYTRAEADYASALYTLMFQKLLINYATGTLKFEDIP